MSELQEIKKRIFKEEKIKDILKKLECWNIHDEQNGKLIVAALPDGDNKRSVQIKNNEFLTSHIRSKGIDGDIFDIVSYIIYNAESEEDRKKCLSKSKYWICNQLNWYEYIDEFYKLTDDTPSPIPQYNKWLYEIQKQRQKHDIRPNKIRPITILDEYGIVPYKKWLDEGLSIKTQKKFGVGIDVRSERITFPVHNKNGELIAVKGRYCGKDKEIEENYKYLYLYPCNKSIEFFNLHRALPYIKSKNEVIVVEGAKTVMYLDQWGYKNAISIEGDSLSETQINILKDLGIGIKFVFAWDKDKDVEFVFNEVKKLKGRLKYAIYDKDNLLSGKDSPCDKGKDVFETLYNKYNYKIKV